MYMRYRHEERAGVLIKQLCHKEEGIMSAEQAVKRVSRDMRRYARRVAEMKNQLDRAMDWDHAREEGIAIGRAEGRAESLQEVEKNKAVEIARNLKAAGVSGEIIIKTTGLKPGDF